MLNVHKIISSPEAAIYLPFALSKLRQFSKYEFVMEQTFVFGSVTCKVAHYPHAGQQFVHLYGEEPLTYEFFTTDKISPVDGYGTPPYLDGISGSYVCGHSTRVRAANNGFNRLKTSSWTSLGGATYLDPVHTHPDDVPLWVGRRSYNNQKVAFQQEYTVRKSEGGATDKVEYLSTPAAGHQMVAHDNVPSGAFGLGRNPVHLGGDIGWDLHQPVYKSGKKIAEIQPLLPPPFWWRRGTVALVKDADGVEHSITIVTDAMSNFYFFRTLLGEEDTIATPLYAQRYVPQDKFIKVEAGTFLPAWVEPPTVDTMRPYAREPLYLYGYSPSTTAFMFPFPTTAPGQYVPSYWMPGGDGWVGSADTSNVVQIAEYLWAFNSDGSAAAAIVHEDKGTAQYPMPSQDEDPQNPAPPRDIKVMRWGYIDMWIPSRVEGEKSEYLDGHGKLDNIRLRQRGLVSVNINISIFGTGPTDFTATITLDKQIRDRHFTDVDFAMKHPALEAKGVMRDDLVASEVEIYTADGDKYSAFGEAYYFFTARNIQHENMPEPLLRWKMDHVLYTQEQLVKLAALNFGDLSKVTPWGGGDPVSPYGSIFLGEFGTEYQYNAMFYSVVSAFPGSPDPSGHYGASVMVADLKSLSFIAATSAYPYVSNRGAHLYVFGDHVESSGTNPATSLTDYPSVSGMALMPETPTQSELTAAGYAGMHPYSYFVLYSRCAAASGPSQATHLLSVHPSGSYSAYFHNWATGNNMVQEPIIDVITHARVKADGSVAYHKTTHREMFNKAFAQNRAYEDYSIGGVYEFGMFASAGMWL